MKKIIYILLVSVFVFASCVETQNSEVDSPINPSTHPTLTITPVDPSLDGSTTNEGDNLAIPFMLTLDKAIEVAVDLDISARQIGGTASADDYTFSTAKIAANTTEAIFTLFIKEDGFFEETETLEVEIGAFVVGNRYLVQEGSTTTFSINIENCDACITCDWTFDMHDVWGDGWNGAFLTMDVEGVTSDFTLSDGYDGQHIIPVAHNKNVTVSYTAGAWENEVTYELYDANGALVVADGPFPTTGQVYTTLNTCL